MEVTKGIVDSSVEANPKVTVDSATMDTSKKYQVNGVDLWKAGRLMLVALAGTALTVLTQLLGDFDFGQWQFLIIPLLSGLIELGRKYLTNYSVTDGTIK